MLAPPQAPPGAVMPSPAAPAPAPAAATALGMRWEDLCFLHWRYPVDALRQRLPPGLEPDLLDGEAWLGVVPFRMRALRPLGRLRLPGVRDFLELNLRTYVRDHHGRPGVWFFTLDCNDPLAVWSARVGFGLRYHHAAMRASPPVPDAPVAFVSRRAGRTNRLRYARASVWRAAAGQPLERFLLERYRLFAWRAQRGQLWTGQVRHQPYRCADAAVRVACDGIFRTQGFEPPGRPPDHALVAAGVAVRAGFPGVV